MTTARVEYYSETHRDWKLADATPLPSGFVELTFEGSKVTRLLSSKGVTAYLRPVQNAATTLAARTALRRLALC